MSVTKIDQSRFTQHEENGGSSAARTLQEALHLPRKESWWKQYFKWEKNLTVAGRTIEKGWVVPQPLGIALIVLILSGVAGLYWTMSARIEAKDNAYQEQRDMLIEIKTELKIQKEHELEYRDEVKDKLGDLEAWQQVTNKDLAKLLRK